MGDERLQASDVRTTVAQLERRMTARFPGRGIVDLSTRLLALIDAVEETAPDLNNGLRRARLVSRVLAAGVAIATAVAVGVVLRDGIEGDMLRGVAWVPLVESMINDVVFAALAMFFLYSFPERMQRGRALRLLHQLRSLAHVVDMHQLTKDPERYKPDWRPTSASIDPGLATPRDMEYYFEYCSEMFSLIGKGAALVAEESRDTVVLDAVANIEQLTTSLSRKVWQKISLLPKA